jgi:hypothetical protein
VSRFTIIGIELWTWEPWRRLNDRPDAQTLWLALLSTAAAKRSIPGLWEGGVGTIAEATGRGYQDVAAALSCLQERRMVVTDDRLNVTRFTGFPDKSEAATSGKIIRSWWNRFGAIPACAVRDAHVPLLRWLAEPFSAKDARAAWDQTFGTLPQTSHLQVVGEGIGKGTAYPTGEGIGNPIASQASLFVSEGLGKGTGEGIGNPTRKGQVPDQVQVQGDQRGECERGLAEGSGEQNVAGIPVAADIAGALAKGWQSWRDPNDVDPNMRRRR